MFTKCSFDAAENKLDYYRRRDCIEKLYKKLKEHATKIINYKEKEMILLTHEENKSFEGQEVCHICKEEFCTNENNENEFKVKKKKKKKEITVITLENLEGLLIISAISNIKFQKYSSSNA